VKKTQPKSRGVDKDTDPSLLAAQRYGTDDMIEIWGAERTFAESLRVQAASIEALSELHPDIVPPEEARELIDAANLETIEPQRIRELEEQTGHDVIAINRAWGEQVGPEAATHINKLKTSADTTEPAKALQLSASLEVIADSIENLRDITLERAMEWIDTPHMDVSHWYDALPVVAGRPLAFYAEMLKSDLDRLAYVYNNSIIGKWADATGSHHSATALGVDGMELEESFCRKFGIDHMIAPAQIPGREFIADVVYVLTRTGETISNLANYVRWGRSSDVGLFTFPRGKKGSSAMPHKDTMGGNPTAEEQAGSFAKYMEGVMMTALSTCEFAYARDLTGSSSDRMNFEGAFKFGDHVIRRMASVMYKLVLDEERSRQRVERTYGTVTSQQVMSYLTDRRKTDRPMTRGEAHELTARLATQAYDERTSFSTILLGNDEITSRLESEVITEISNPFTYLGESAKQVRGVFDRYHGRTTLKH